MPIETPIKEGAPITEPMPGMPGIGLPGIPIEPPIKLSAERVLAEPATLATDYGVETVSKIDIRDIRIIPGGGVDYAFNKSREGNVAWKVMTEEQRAVFQAALDLAAELIETSLKQ